LTEAVRLGTRSQQRAGENPLVELRLKPPVAAEEQDPRFHHAVEMERKTAHIRESFVVTVTGVP
jgi:hypothetical protein